MVTNSVASACIFCYAVESKGIADRLRHQSETDDSKTHCSCNYVKFQVVVMSLACFVSLVSLLPLFFLALQSTAYFLHDLDDGGIAGILAILFDLALHLGALGLGEQ